MPGQTMIFNADGLEGRAKVLGFDLGRRRRYVNKAHWMFSDGTLIKTKSGNVFPKHDDDWQLWDKSIPAKIKKYYDDGFKICIFTNQKGIQVIRLSFTNGSAKKNLQVKKVQPAAFRLKIQQICAQIGVPMQVRRALPSS